MRALGAYREDRTAGAVSAAVETAEEAAQACGVRAELRSTNFQIEIRNYEHRSLRGSMRVTAAALEQGSVTFGDERTTFELRQRRSAVTSPYM